MVDGPRDHGAPPCTWSRPDEEMIVISMTWAQGADVKPSHGKPPDITAQDTQPHARREQREALPQILERGQQDMRAGNPRDLGEFLEELDSECADL
jgi:hypothetical protein